jgi:hypothetical protein
MSQENFLRGAPRIHRAAETWIRCLASHSVPSHATVELSAHPDLAHLTAEPGICNRPDLSGELLALVRGWIDRVVRCVTKVRDGIACRFIAPSSTLHPLPISWPGTPATGRSSGQNQRAAAHAVFVSGRIHRQCRPDIWLTSCVGHPEGLVIHADAVRRHVEKSGLDRKRRRLLVLDAQRSRTDRLR